MSGGECCTKNTVPIAGARIVLTVTEFFTRLARLDLGLVPQMCMEME